MNRDIFFNYEPEIKIVIYYLEKNDNSELSNTKATNEFIMLCSKIACDSDTNFKEVFDSLVGEQYFKKYMTFLLGYNPRYNSKKINYKDFGDEKYTDCDTRLEEFLNENCRNLVD